LVYSPSSANGRGIDLCVQLLPLSLSLYLLVPILVAKSLRQKQLLPRFPWRNLLSLFSAPPIFALLFEYSLSLSPLQVVNLLSLYSLVLTLPYNEPFDLLRTLPYFLP
jgi:hypothetical protein